MCSETASYYQGNLRKGAESVPGKGGVWKNENTAGKGRGKSEVSGILINLGALEHAWWLCFAPYTTFTLRQFTFIRNAKSRPGRIEE